MNQHSALYNNKWNTNTPQHTNQHQFHPRIQNLTNILFIVNKLLCKGLQYNLHFRNKSWVETSTTETEMAVIHGNTTEQEYRRQPDNRNIMTLLKSNTTREQNKNGILLQA
jgi:hypothetical protein